MHKIVTQFCEISLFHSIKLLKFLCHFYAFRNDTKKYFYCQQKTHNNTEANYLTRENLNNPYFTTFNLY